MPLRPFLLCQMPRLWGREALSRESRSAHRGLLGRSWLTPLWPFSRYQMPPLENAKRFPRCEAALDVGAPRHQDEVDAFIATVAMLFLLRDRRRDAVHSAARISLPRDR